MNARHLLFIGIIVMFGLSACGGGSSGGGSSSPTTSSAVGQSSSSSALSSQSDSSSVTSSSSVQSSSAVSSDPLPTQMITGTAAIGAPIIGGTVVARCSNGRGFEGDEAVMTQDDGSFTGYIEVDALPCALQVTYDMQVYDPELDIYVQEQGALHSSISEFSIVNITPLTDLIVANASNLLPADWFLSDNWVTIQSKLLQSQDEVLLRLIEAGFNLPSLPFEPFTTPFDIGDSWDKLLDDIQEVVVATLGSHQQLLNLVKDGNLIAIPDWPVQSSSSSSYRSSVASSETSSSIEQSSSSSSSLVNPIPSDLWDADSSQLPASGNYVYLESDPEDFVAWGNSHLYTPIDSILSVSTSGLTLEVSVNGDEIWGGYFQAMNGLNKFMPGFYGDLQRYPFHDPEEGGLSWSGEGRGCNTLTGWFVIDSITYDAGVLTAIDLRFAQHCEGRAAALHGKIHWRADDAASPPGPVNPIPGDLWDADSNLLPASGNYIYLESETGDYIGGGNTYLYTPIDSHLSVSASNELLNVSINGNERWAGEFQTMTSLENLQSGFYGDLQRFPFHNPAKGGLSWSGEGRRCNTLTGWFVVDSVTYASNELTAIDLRFAQHCRGDASTLHGKIHWRADDLTSFPGPVSPIPDHLWDADPDKLPASGNYVYLESGIGDFIGRGENYLYTQADSLFSVSLSDPTLIVSIQGDEDWVGYFQAMAGLDALQAGFYGDLQRHGFHNPIKGGLSWSGEGRGCNTLTGWFAVDSVTYNSGVLTAIDLRFAQHCEGRAVALYGKVHWRADDTTLPPGPVNPIPVDLWDADASQLPASGNYIYLESDSGDYIGDGGNYLYTPIDSILSVSVANRLLKVSINGYERWDGEFSAMDSLNKLQSGFYGDLKRYLLHNRVKGGLSWSGEGRRCNTLTGWFVVDSITYDSNVLTAIDLRFAQHCESEAPAIYGKIHWRADDATSPPGPVNPIPDDLWDTDSNTLLPASGNYVYLESDPGDYIGAGENYLYTTIDSIFSVSTTGRILDIFLNGDENWGGQFQTMIGLDRIQRGFYGNLQDYNPAKGSLGWGGEGRSCNTRTGWFVVDSVTYDSNMLTAIDLRFAQHCEGGVPALYGKIHWRAE